MPFQTFDPSNTIIDALLSQNNFESTFGSIEWRICIINDSKSEVIPIAINSAAHVDVATNFFLLDAQAIIHPNNLNINPVVDR
ncbi:hypothetical protein O181_063143 [Austropuccinia psidii MF-1]|uniref:Uncharacterized protein n=1 Tax=Austropuccinia psidii MF-1 TaxID=1389203 RepID=A0A9Q3EKU6_9BASI|nr:hypothetical protein [Austropuccinia psidii MF-1]